MASEGEDSDGSQPNVCLREQDRYLPIANISRIMKRALPPNAKISKEAKETVQECVSEFVCFITSEASEKCAKENRKTINGDDILTAMQNLGFDHYIEPLRCYLIKYREQMGEKHISKPRSPPDKKELEQQQQPQQQQPPQPTPHHQHDHHTAQLTLHAMPPTLHYTTYGLANQFQLVSVPGMLASASYVEDDKQQ